MLLHTPLVYVPIRSFPPDQVSKLRQVIYGLAKMVALAYDELQDGVEPEIEVLSKMLSYFGPVPQRLLDHIQGNQWTAILETLDQSFDVSTPRKPFHMWRDIEGLEPGDMEFISRSLKLDPGSSFTNTLPCFIPLTGFPIDTYKEESTHGLMRSL